MSNQVPAYPLAQNPQLQNRPLAHFHPSVWGDQFIAYTPEDEVTRACEEKQVEDVKEQVRAKMMAAADNPPQQLNFIDAMQRLGVAYHFEREIEEALHHVCDSHHGDDDKDDGNLYEVALLFRLLRGQGFHISCGIFNKFKDEEGRFKEALVDDVRGMLSLYEAAHFRIRGEEILDEALAFTTTHLKSMLGHLEYPLSAQVDHTLRQPIRKGLERLEARWYIPIYQDEAFHDKTLLNLAKLDFNLVQSLHKEELSNIARWWKELDFATKLPFARDRLVEAYFWILGGFFEPQYLWARRILTKMFAMSSILDDIYDAYGTPEELKPFTEAIERWDVNVVDHLPEYMRLWYVALLDVYEEIEKGMEKENQYQIHYAKEAMKKQARSYFCRVKVAPRRTCTNNGRVHEYSTRNSRLLLTTMSFMGMGEIVTREALDWVSSGPNIITASNIIGRVLDDIKSHKYIWFEQKRAHMASSIECYMKQYGVSEEQAYREFHKKIENAWKDINQECLKPTTVPMPLLHRVLNLTRVLEVIYKEKDEYTHVGKLIKDNIASLLIDPVV